MSEIPEGYREDPAEDRAKAQVFFGHGRTVANNGNYDYAIEMFLQGLSLDPDDVGAHQELRDISFRRTASGGKGTGMFGAMKLKRSTRDDKQNMLNAEKLLAYDPGNTDHMQSMMQCAHKAGYYDTVLWIGPILQKANLDDKKPDYNKFLLLRDIYKSLRQWRLAADAAQCALRMRPQDMDLSTEVKNLGAMDTMDTAGYAKGGGFRDQVRDMDGQTRLFLQDKDVTDRGVQAMMIAEAEAQYRANPDDSAKAMKLVEAMEKTDNADYENRAIEILQVLFERTKQFRYRQRIGAINMRQMNRMERSKRAALAQSPKDPELIKDYTNFKREQNEFELKEYQLAAEAYPTEMKWRYEVGVRLYNLQRYQDAIPVFQEARMDPKYRVDAGLLVGRSFLAAGFADEADDTLAMLIRDYQLIGDTKSKEMYYWRGRALEQKGQKPEALSHYSKVAQWEFNYLDVQARIKHLRGH